MKVSFGFEIEPKSKTRGLIRQVHGKRVVPYRKAGEIEDADGIFTGGNEELYVFSADCLPVLFFSEKLTGAVHAGWRGTMQGVVGAMLSEFRAIGESPHVILGPCLLKCCFQVQADFVATFSGQRGDIGGFIEKRGTGMYFDLIRFVKERELAEVSDINDSAVRCTRCSSPELPSYRRNGAADPRLRSWIRKVSVSFQA